MEKNILVKAIGLHKLFNKTSEGFYNTSKLSEEILKTLSSDSIIYILADAEDESMKVHINGDYSIKKSDTFIWALGLLFYGGILDFKVENQINITYNDLVQLRDTKLLIPGMKYRIIDYVTKTDQSEEYKSAEHPFDIIVTATDNMRFDSSAKAVRRDDDLYFSTSHLELWELKYDIDTYGYEHVDSSCPGVIYWMKDDKGNECPYDFKNILFKGFGPNLDALKFYYTFSEEDSQKNIVDSSIDSIYMYSNKFSKKCWKNVFIGNAYQSNTFGEGCRSNTIGNSCSLNTFGNGCINNTFGKWCQLNTFGDNCDSNTFGENCSSNTFGDSCYSNTIPSYVNNCEFRGFNFNLKFELSRYLGGEKHYRNVVITAGYGNVTINDQNYNQDYFTVYPKKDIYATKEEVNAALEGKANVGDSYLKNETYTQIEVNNAIASAVSSVYKYIATVDALPKNILELEVGWVYNLTIEHEGYPAGTNWAVATDPLNPETKVWDPLMGLVDVSKKADKSYVDEQLKLKANTGDSYLTSQTYTKEEVNNLIAGGGGGGSSTVAMIPITYAELKAKRDSSQLKPGVQYRITDYVTIAKASAKTEGYRSANHAFDLIVTANSTNKLNENARAIQHEGDRYFKDSKLEKWKIKYTIDNDTDYQWIDETCKGTIYYLQDEFNNIFPYDFKNIQFQRTDIPEILDPSKWYYTFNSYLGTQDNTIIYKPHGPYNNHQEFSQYKTFKNIFLGASILNNILKDGCRNNIFQNFNDSNILEAKCYSNTFGEGCRYNVLGTYCSSNIFGEHCESNTFGDRCSDLRIPNWVQCCKFEGDNNYLQFILNPIIDEGNVEEIVNHYRNVIITAGYGGKVGQPLVINDQNYNQDYFTIYPEKPVQVAKENTQNVYTQELVDAITANLQAQIDALKAKS